MFSLLQPIYLSGSTPKLANRTTILVRQAQPTRQDMPCVGPHKGRERQMSAGSAGGFDVNCRLICPDDWEGVPPNW